MQAYDITEQNKENNLYYSYRNSLRNSICLSLATFAQFVHALMEQDFANSQCESPRIPRVSFLSV